MAASRSKSRPSAMRRQLHMFMSKKMQTSCLLLVNLFFATLAFSQGGANGTIVGTVTDSSGAVVANAKVDVTNTATGVVVHTETSTTGDYTVPYLNPASYKVSVTATGFQKAESTAFTLIVGQQARVNITMKPGSAVETIEVQASSVGIQTESPEISNTIAQKQIEELPLNGRNFVQLLTLGEGAVTLGGEQGTMRQGQGNAISINGGRPTSNNYTLDGLVNTDTSLNTPAVILSQDAIQEFKTQSGA